MWVALGRDEAAEQWAHCWGCSGREQSVPVTWWFCCWWAFCLVIRALGAALLPLAAADQRWPRDGAEGALPSLFGGMGKGQCRNGEWGWRWQLLNPALRVMVEKERQEQKPSSLPESGTVRVLLVLVSQ